MESSMLFSVPRLIDYETTNNIVTSITFPVAGVTMDNRQPLIEKMAPGLPLYLEREPSNSHDANAIRIMTAFSECVGYVPRQLAARLAVDLDAGVRYSVVIDEITGREYTYLGLNVIADRID